MTDWGEKDRWEKLATVLLFIIGWIILGALWWFVGSRIYWSREAP